MKNTEKRSSWPLHVEIFCSNCWPSGSSLRDRDLVDVNANNELRSATGRERIRKKYGKPFYSSQLSRRRSSRAKRLLRTQARISKNQEHSRENKTTIRTRKRQDCGSFRARSIQPKTVPTEWSTSKGGPVFSKIFPVGPNRSIEFWTEISGNFGPSFFSF